MLSSPTHIPIRPDWLATRQEVPLEPGLPVIDAHHHLYARPGTHYLLDEYLSDIRGGGHPLLASVIVQARSMLRSDAPPHLQTLGETEFANGVAAMSASGIYGKERLCAAIVGHADLTLGDSVRPVLERHVLLAGGGVADGGRFRGVRQSLTWDRDASLTNPLYPTTEHMMDSRSFRAGFAHLAPLNLSFEGWVFFHQLPKLAALARAFPDTRIVLNHCGGIVGIADYAARRDEIFARWAQGLKELAACPNVMVKLSGLGMRLGGFGFEERPQAPASVDLAGALRPWIEWCIEVFGAERCMWGSNFPVDKGSCAYGIGLNALKRLTSLASDDDKAAIFWRSARDFYRLPVAVQENAHVDASDTRRHS